MGILMVLTKLVEWPVVLSTPCRQNGVAGEGDLLPRNSNMAFEGAFDSHTRARQARLRLSHWPTQGETGSHHMWENPPENSDLHMVASLYIPTLC